MIDELSMKPSSPRILTINVGSSSIKFALFRAGDPPERLLGGGIERIGQPEATLRAKGVNKADNFSHSVAAPDHTAAVGALMDWIVERSEQEALTGIGHRVVHGGPTYSQPQRITSEMIEELSRLSPFDPEHLPEEILLIDAVRRRFPDLPQVACKMDAYWRAANYLSVGQIYLYDNPLLKRAADARARQAACCSGTGARRRARTSSTRT
jgi:acetate kinase